MTGETQRRACSTCGGRVGRRSATGICRACGNRARASDPHYRERQRQGVRRSFAENPERVEIARAAAANARAHITGRTYFRGERAKEASARSKLMHPAGSPARRKAGAHGRDTKLSHIPPHLRDDYRRLTRKGYSAAEAAGLVMDLHDTELRRFRREVREMV